MMATVEGRCVRCRRLRPLFAAPAKGHGPAGQSVMLLCLECATREQVQKPVQVTK